MFSQVVSQRIHLCWLVVKQTVAIMMVFCQLKEMLDVFDEVPSSSILCRKYLGTEHVVVLSILY
jgi:hypothetical protein